MEDQPNDKLTRKTVATLAFFIKAAAMWYYVLDEALIWLLLTLALLCPLIIPWYLGYRFGLPHWKAIAHALSGLLILILVLIWVLAYRNYHRQGGDDGSSSMATFLASAGSAVLLAFNVVIYHPWLKGSQQQRGGQRERRWIRWRRASR